MPSGRPIGGGELFDDKIESIGFMCLVGLCVAAGVVFAADTTGANRHRAVFEIDDAINPNSASPASLARLPRIGPARARAIVSYRLQIGDPADRPSVFRHAEDLRQVTGIGPATVEAVRPWLSFGANTVDEWDISGRRP